MGLGLRGRGGGGGGGSEKKAEIQVFVRCILGPSFSGSYQIKHISSP